MRFAAPMLVFLFLLAAPAFALGCNPGTVACIDSHSYHACNEYAVWGEPVSCLASTPCVNGVCEIQLGCSPGARECVGSTSYKVCNNYALWEPTVSCLAGQLCSNGECYSPFPKQCDYPGQARCNPSDSGEVQTCNGKYQWEHKQSCDYGCQSGYCRTCSPGNTRCTGTYTYQSCNNDASWGSDSRCPNNLVCDGGSCVVPPTLKCTSIGSFRCSPDSSTVLQSCGSNYQWDDYTYCSLGCSSGACKVCTYGDKKCKDNGAYLNCGPGGQWGGETSCPTGYFCFSGSCQVPSGNQCSSQGAMRCSPSNSGMIQICNNNYVYSDYQICSQGCINGACADCKAGTSICSGASAASTCGANGKYGVPQNCASGYSCTNGNCVQTAVCTDGQKSCASNNVYLCKSGQWASYLTCPSGSNCVTSAGTAYCEAKPVPSPSPTPSPSPSPEPQNDAGLLGLGMIGGAIAAVVCIGVVAGVGYFLLTRKK